MDHSMVAADAGDQHVPDDGLVFIGGEKASVAFLFFWQLSGIAPSAICWMIDGSTSTVAPAGSPQARQRPM